MAGYNRIELQAIISDQDATAAQVSAAQQWLQAMDAKLPSLVEVCDRTNGQSTKHIKSETQVERVKRVITPAPGRN